MAKFDSVAHPDKIAVTLDKDDRIRSMYMSYLLFEDDDKLVSFNTFSEAVLLSSKDDAFKAKAHLFTQQEDITEEETRNLFRDMLSHKQN